MIAMPEAGGTGHTCVIFFARRAWMICFFMSDVTVLCLTFSMSSSSTLVFRCVPCCLFVPAPYLRPDVTCSAGTQQHESISHRIANSGRYLTNIVDKFCTK